LIHGVINYPNYVILYCLVEIRWDQSFIWQGRLSGVQKEQLLTLIGKKKLTKMY